MKTFIIPFLVCLLNSFACFAQYDCGSFDDCLTLGIAAYQDENYEGAVGYLTNAINKWDRSMSRDKKISAHMYRGKAFLEMDSLKRAYQDCCRIIYNFEENNIPAYRMRALVLDKQGEYDRSISDYTNVIKAENKADDYAARAMVYNKLQNYDEAINDLLKAIKLNPKWVDYHLKLGQVYFLSKQYDKVQEEAEQAADLNATIPDPYMLSAMAYMATKNFDKALEQAESAVTFAPETKEVYEMRSMIYNKLGKHAEAIADLKKAIDLGSEISRQDLKNIYKIDY